MAVRHRACAFPNRRLAAHLRGLERDLGVRLFRRTRRRVDLTEAGSVFASVARRLIAEGERVIASIRNSAPEIRYGSASLLRFTRVGCVR